jgi:hypothetical protein
MLKWAKAPNAVVPLTLIRIDEWLVSIDAIRNKTHSATEREKCLLPQLRP